ncbi:MAG: APC family permease [Vulcanimicrobiaceae bacterium]
MLKFFDISVLASASMGPAYSLASTMGPMVAAAGSAAPSALIALCAIMFCMAIAFAQLSRVAPNAGSSYSWIRMAFGHHAGAYGAWLLLLSNFFATMATAVPAGIYTLELLAPARAQDPLWAAGVGAMWIVASAVLLYAGIRPTALVTLVALMVELAVLLASAVAAWIVPHAPAASVAHVPSLPAMPLSLAGFVSAMTLGIWMSDGWEISASASEEVNDDTRASGRGGIAGLLVTTAVLAICMVAYLHLGTAAGFAAHEADSLAYVSDLLGGEAWRFAIVATVMVSTLSTLWTTILYLSRSVYAMGRDGVLPQSLGTLDDRDEPLLALASIALLVTGCELLTGLSQSAAEQLTLVVNASSVFLGLLFVLSAAAAVRHFWPSRGVVLPLAGAVALLAVLAATIGSENTQLQWYAYAGVLLGVPFAFWRGRATP